MQNLVSGMLEPMMKTFSTLTFISWSFFFLRQTLFQQFPVQGHQTNSPFVSLSKELHICLRRPHSS